MPKNVVCKKCNNLVNGWCEKVIDSPDPDMVRDCQHFWEKTNTDRIRAMSDEELAKYLFDVEQGNFTIDCCDDRFCDTQNCCHDCTGAAIKWLKQPAE